MRPFAQFVILFAVFSCAMWGAAQTTPLPPGTAVPNDTAAQSAPNNPGARATALLSQAEDDIARGHSSDALPLLNKVVADKSMNAKTTARALYDRGYVEQARHESAAAQSDFQKAIAADPKQFESHAALGRMLAAQGQWKQAQGELEKAALLTPASGETRQQVAEADRTLARVDAQLHDPAAASDALIAALKLTPESPDDTLFAAQLAADAGNHADAESAYRKALAQDPKSIPAAEGLARALVRQGKFADAEPVIRKALQSEPNDPVLLAELATALAGQGKTQSAIAQLEALHRQNPDQSAVTRMLADLYSGAGQAAKAGPLYRQLVADDPKNPVLLTAAGENSILEQHWADAEREFQKSLGIQPAQPDAWSGLAFAASQDGQYEVVLNALDRRQQYAPDVPATLFLRATALDHLHRTKEAVLYYRKFLSAAQGKFPDEEAQTRQRLKALGR